MVSITCADIGRQWLIRRARFTVGLVRATPSDPVTVKPSGVGLKDLNFLLHKLQTAAAAVNCAPFLSTWLPKPAFDGYDMWYVADTEVYLGHAPKR